MVGVGLQAPIITILAFIPMLLIAFAYKERQRDPTAAPRSRGAPAPSGRAPGGWAAGASWRPTSS
ncbi:hypothetical protein ACFQ0M_07455 [Kitasatospora aburaviensis]